MATAFREPKIDMSLRNREICGVSKKIIYPHRKQALTAQGQMGAGFHTYKCVNCGKYHIGHKETIWTWIH